MEQSQPSAMSVLPSSLFSGCGTQQLKADLAAANAQATQLEADLAAARAASESIQDANALAQLRLERYRDLAAQLRAAYGDEGLSIKIRGGRMVVQLPNSILFDSGQIAIKDDGKTTLAKFAAVMKDVPKRRFLIAGHTDNVPVKAGARFTWSPRAWRALRWGAPASPTSSRTLPTTTMTAGP